MPSPASCTMNSALGLAGVACLSSVEHQFDLPAASTSPHIVATLAERIDRLAELAKLARIVTSPRICCSATDKSL